MAKLVCEFCENINEYKIFVVYGGKNYLYIMFERETEKFIGAFENLDDARDFACGYTIKDVNGNYCFISGINKKKEV